MTDETRAAPRAGEELTAAVVGSKSSRKALQRHELSFRLTAASLSLQCLQGSK
jgi:hypothetical protein